MKYFTPDLIVAYGADDSATWKDAEMRWDTACEQYEAYLGSITAQMPPALLRLVEGHSLHDAVIRAMGRRQGDFVIVLQLDAPPHALLTLTYALVEEPVILRGVLPPEYRATGSQVDWQYDEIEKVEGEPITWRQSVLLSNGWELRLHFRQLHLDEVQPILPAPESRDALLPMTGTTRST